jgi:UDP-N-acetylglucosamine 2-epimerase (non-hydrolysing)
MTNQAPSERRPVALVVGTRPEAIKLAPVHRALQGSRSLRPLLISSGQHSELLEPTLRELELVPDQELAIMERDQTPNDVAARLLERLPCRLSELAPCALVVQGDTTTTLAAALVGFHLGLPVAHVEAGLRTHDLANPFPEEANRQLVDRISRWCFAPTAGARANLIAEGIASDRVHVTGNTAVDSLLWARGRATTGFDTPTLLVTLHRRESFGGELEQVLLAVHDFLESAPDASAVWPVHLNPSVARLAERAALAHPRLQRMAPLSYLELVAALASCRLVLTDSGGIQEECPTLGKAVLVARDTTERPEAVQSGMNRIVGRSRERVRRALAEAWAEPPYAGPIPAPNPYGDGRAGERIAALLERALCTVQSGRREHGDLP